MDHYTRLVETAVAIAVSGILNEIERELERSKGNPDECKALRRIGRYILKEFEGVGPRGGVYGAARFAQLFSEENEQRSP
ncbi:MAG: hypothetical protein HYV13_04445 [Candidatus Doudnabacteria bacterium]|nr:hypothetical protein [Candidatus Doudnabacteria bacterium]